MKNLKINIFIPTFNRSHFLPKAIESALKQDYPNLDVIVSDNHSEDDTPEIVKKYKANKRFKYFRNQKNLGMVGNWRKALKNYLDGDFFLILSDDDYLIDKSYISKAVSLINTNPEILAVYANGYIIDKSLNKFHELSLPFNNVEEGKKIFLSRGKIVPQDLTLCNVLFNREMALQLNAFSNDKDVTCDSELFLKICLYGKIGVIKDFVSVYVFHSDNLINKVNNDYELLINSLDHLINPYLLAQELNIFSDDELKNWEERILKRSIQGTLATVKAIHKNKYENALEIIKNKNNNLLKDALNDPKFRYFIITEKIGIYNFIFDTFEWYKKYKYSKTGQSLENFNIN
ncbi:MAG: hypothetical protein CVV28_01330 [Methanobacteriales archaeon HGW-Methanobacteriales-1]|jgi:glycosyltransferase involved in cell wall biosynthesis|nr:MAG: hypothetical protein CVV28_01330 [Methanobacteriales archaeon HGW-Methanobacteriales-1]